MGTGVSANPISSSASDYVSHFLIILWLLSQFLLFSDWFFSFCFLFCWHFSFFLSLSFVPLVDGLGTFSLQRNSVFSLLPLRVNV